MVVGVNSKLNGVPWLSIASDGYMMVSKGKAVDVIVGVSVMVGWGVDDDGIFVFLIIRVGVGFNLTSSMAVLWPIQYPANRPAAKHNNEMAINPTIKNFLKVSS